MDPLIYSFDLTVGNSYPDETICFNDTYDVYRKELSDLRITTKNFPGVWSIGDLWSTPTQVNRFIILNNMNTYREFIYEHQKRDIMRLISKIREDNNMEMSNITLSYYSESKIKPMIESFESMIYVQKQIYSSTPLYLDYVLSNNKIFSANELLWFKNFSRTIRFWPNVKYRMVSFTSAHSLVQTFIMATKEEAQHFLSFLQSEKTMLSKFEGAGTSELRLHIPN